MKTTAFFTLALLLVATVAPAQMHRDPPMGNGGGPMHITVAADGTVITFANNGSAPSMVAFTPTGAKAWTYAIGDGTGPHQVEVAGTLVLFAANNKLVALSVSNGAKAWELALDGYAMDITPAPTQIYLTVIKTTTSHGGNMPMRGTAERTLVAVSTSGVILWKQPL